jgi:tRNA A37 methylthiotransferase MiaB
MSRTIALVSLGCAKNLVNSEQMLYLLDKAGYAIAPEPDGADAVIINTCGFIDAAKSEAIDTILDAARLKAEGRLQKIIVTGCLTERYQSEVMDETAGGGRRTGRRLLRRYSGSCGKGLSGREAQAVRGQERPRGGYAPHRFHRPRLGLPPHRGGLRQFLRLLRHSVHPGALPLADHGEHHGRG